MEETRSSDEIVSVSDEEKENLDDFVDLYDIDEDHDLVDLTNIDSEVDDDYDIDEEEYDYYSIRSNIEEEIKNGIHDEIKYLQLRAHKDIAQIACEAGKIMVEILHSNNCIMNPLSSSEEGLKFHKKLGGAGKFTSRCLYYDITNSQICYTRNFFGRFRDGFREDIIILIHDSIIEENIDLQLCKIVKNVVQSIKFK